MFKTTFDPSQKISFIKEVREWAGCGLLEAKNIADRFFADLEAHTTQSARSERARKQRIGQLRTMAATTADWDAAELLNKLADELESREI